MKKERARRTDAPKKKAASRISSKPGAEKKSKPAVSKPVKKTAAKPAARKTRKIEAPVPKSSRIEKAVRSLPSLTSTASRKKTVPPAITVKPPAAKPEVSKKLAAFHSDEIPKPSRPVLTELPFSYNQTKLVAMPRDPWWIYTYWDFSSETWGWLADFRARDREARLKLRVHNTERKTFFDVDVPYETKNWYLELGEENAPYEIELGILDSRGKFHRIALSNRFRMPRSGPSDNIDPEWNLNEFELSELYRLSGGGQKPGFGSGDVSSSKRRSPSGK